MDSYIWFLCYIHNIKHILCSYVCMCTFWCWSMKSGICMAEVDHLAWEVPEVLWVWCRHLSSHTHTGVDQIWWLTEGLIPDLTLQICPFIMCCIVEEQHTSWLKFSSLLELWYCSQRYSSNVEQSVFFKADRRNCSALFIIPANSSSSPNPSSRERSTYDFIQESLGPTLLVVSQSLSAWMAGRRETKL